MTTKNEQTTELADKIRDKISEINALIKEASEENVGIEINIINTRTVLQKFDVPILSVRIYKDI